jgi:2-dehydro-3-deoxygalactonokinase
VQRVVEYVDAALSQLLFETRSRQLRAGMSPAQAEAFLSGLLIGHDVAGAIRTSRARGPVTLVGTPLLCDGYRIALERFGVASSWIDGGEAVVAGLRSIAFGDEERISHD